MYTSALVALLPLLATTVQAIPTAQYVDGQEFDAPSFSVQSVYKRAGSAASSVVAASASASAASGSTWSNWWNSHHGGQVSGSAAVKVSAAASATISAPAKPSVSINASAIKSEIHS